MSADPFSPELSTLRGVSVEELRQEFDLLVHWAPPAADLSQILVRGAVCDNRRLRAGQLFIALAGEHVHAARFAPAAAASGAAAILTDAAGAQIISGQSPAAGPGSDGPALPLPVLVAADPLALAGQVAAACFDRPGQDLCKWAITGTNGKTTITFILCALLESLQRRAGLVGTIEVGLGTDRTPAALTTPQAPDLQAFAAFARQRGATDLVMEASSHALALGRTEPWQFEVAGFSNLTQDHLDFHHTFEEYFAAKASLFRPEKSQRQVVLVEDQWGQKLAESLAQSQPEQLTVVRRRKDTSAAGGDYASVAGGEAGAAGGEAGCAPSGPLRQVEYTYYEDQRGVQLQLWATGQAECLELGANLPGDFNAANLALATAMVWSAGGADGPAWEHLRQNLPAVLQVQVPGRMQVLSASPRVVVDFAHNPGATEKALQALAPTTAGQLVIVLGSAGQRDREKRPLLGEIACRLADRVIVTDDDPHEEDPAQIRAEVLAGCRGFAGKYREIADRTQAIATAIAEAEPADTVLIAGRGHETIQERPEGPVELDDREVARQALARRPSSHGPGLEEN